MPQIKSSPCLAKERKDKDGCPQEYLRSATGSPPVFRARGKQVPRQAFSLFGMTSLFSTETTGCRRPIPRSKSGATDGRARQRGHGLTKRMSRC